jgi:hypothetical protein
MLAPPKATFDDVNLILRIYDMRREERLREARKWFAASFRVKTIEEFNALCPVGSETNASYRMVVTYWELVASFLTSGVLNPRLFYQSGQELLLTWERVRDVLPGLRELNKNPLTLRNLELAAQGYVAWWNVQAPGAFEAFQQRVRG